MNIELILFILRIAGAAVLLAFVGAIVWFSYRDMKVLSEYLSGQSQQYGRLRVVSTHQTGPTLDSVYPLLPVTTIGRATTNSIILADHYTSSEHLLIIRRGGQWWLEDLGSRNGTLLNEVRLDKTVVITQGDIITIGETQLKVEN
jgi:pSer/pThr/pTyr-binding forkhead associated (FHA) protein